MMTPDDGRIIADIMLASLLASAVRLIVFKSFLEPLAYWAGRRGYHALDWLLGDRLLELPK
jgi:hypothetical protein